MWNVPCHMEAEFQIQGHDRQWKIVILGLISLCRKESKGRGETMLSYFAWWSCRGYLGDQLLTLNSYGEEKSL
jgi:hypothetical protein